MKFGAPYVMMPGARLYIGPHGRPEESMGVGDCCSGPAVGPRGRAHLHEVPCPAGACCPSCAEGGPCEGVGDVGPTEKMLLALGALGLLAWVFRKK